MDQILQRNGKKLNFAVPREKILVFNTSFFDVSQTFIWQQVNILDEQYDVHLLGMSFTNPHKYNMDRWPKYEVSRAPGILNRITNKILGWNFFNFRSYRLLYKLFRENRFTAVHTHFGTNALLILPVLRLFGIPLVVTFHGADASRMVRHRTYRRRLPGLFRYASAIIIVSRHMMKTLKLEQWKEKVHLIPCTVEPDELASFRKGDSDLLKANDQNKVNGYGRVNTGYGENIKNFRSSDSHRGMMSSHTETVEKIDNRPVKILHSGRLTPKKGVPDLIRVFKRLAGKYSGIELHILGDGKDYNLCKSLANKIPQDNRIFFYGAVSHDENMAMMKNADIFVLNSRIADDGDMEGTPVTLLEAMCMSKPVVSTRHAGIPDVITNWQNGLLVDEKDNDALFEAVERLIIDEDLRDSLAYEARRTIQNEYTSEKLQQKLHRVFNTITDTANSETD
jgi:colanic acid/amylovoran biosynthesis glycosyltransferase